MEPSQAAKTRDNLAAAIGLTFLAVFVGLMAAQGAWIFSLALSGGAIATSGLDFYMRGRGRRLRSGVRVTHAVIMAVNVAWMVLIFH